MPKMDQIGKKVAIIQSNYIPWKGYFDIINRVDEFVLFDDVQYTRRDWRNRNKIKTPNSSQWLTIPVDVKGKYLQKIKDIKISDPKWKTNHWKAITSNYSKAPYFKKYYDFFEELYLDSQEKYLSEINYRFLKAICQLLGIKTQLSWSMDYQVIDGKTERLIDLCKKCGATEYLSGPSARGYIDTTLFATAGIALSYIDYTGYPEYEQLYPPFEHAVSIVDLIFNTGHDVHKYMLSFSL
jgi:WbqC-like protein